MRWFAILLLLTTPTFAESVTPSQAAIQVATVVNQMALTLEQQKAQIDRLAKDLADAKKGCK